MRSSNFNNLTWLLPDLILQAVNVFKSTASCYLNHAFLFSLQSQLQGLSRRQKSQHANHLSLLLALQYHLQVFEAAQKQTHFRKSQVLADAVLRSCRKRQKLVVKVGIVLVDPSFDVKLEGVLVVLGVEVSEVKVQKYEAPLWDQKVFKESVFNSFTRSIKTGRPVKSLLFLYECIQVGQFRRKGLVDPAVVKGLELSSKLFNQTFQGSQPEHEMLKQRRSRIGSSENKKYQLLQKLLNQFLLRQLVFEFSDELVHYAWTFTPFPHLFYDLLTDHLLYLVGEDRQLRRYFSEKQEPWRETGIVDQVEALDDELVKRRLIEEKGLGLETDERLEDYFGGDFLHPGSYLKKLVSSELEQLLSEDPVDVRTHSRNELEVEDSAQQSPLLRVSLILAHKNTFTVNSFHHLENVGLGHSS